jgi:5'-nucleotidase
MKLLVTNDDGIDSPFLHELVRALLAAGHALSVVAPKTEQSWIGAAKSRHRPVHAERIDGRAGSPDPAASMATGVAAGSGDPALHLQKYRLGCPTWIVDGTPSDAVNIALDHLLPRDAQPEAVISGINVGGNCSLGFILASGTVAGAWEGVLHGLPAMAVSQEIPEATYALLKEHGGAPDGELLATVRVSAAHVARLAPALFAATPRHSFIVHNLNFPCACRADTPVRRTVPARVHVPGLFSPSAGDGLHRLLWGKIRDISPAAPLTDLACVEQGHISHSVLDYARLGQP